MLSSSSASVESEGSDYGDEAEEFESRIPTTVSPGGDRIGKGIDPIRFHLVINLPQNSTPMNLTVDQDWVIKGFHQMPLIQHKLQELQRLLIEKKIFFWILNNSLPFPNFLL